MSAPVISRAFTNHVADLWVRALSSAYRWRERVFEPSLALAADADIYSKLLQDAVIAHAVQQRKHMVAGSRWQCTPFNQTPASKISAQVMEELLAFVDNFDSARFNLADAIFRGSTYGYIEGERRVLSLYDGIPRFWWVPTAIRDLTKFRIRQVPKLEGEGKNRSVRVDLELWSVAREDWEPLREENRRAIIQHLYNDTEERLGYGHGLVDQMYHYWRAKEIVLTENLAAVERFAQGLLIAKIDSARLTETGNPNTAQVENFIAALEKHKARHILAVDKDDEVEMISPSGEGHQLFESMRNYLDNALRTLIIGANLTSSANEGGSYALADVQADSTQHLINYDRRILGQSLTRSLVKLVWDLNAENFRQLGLGDALPPRFTIVDEKIPDSKKEAEITQILLAAGVKQKADEVYELCGRTQPGPGDEVIEPTPAPSPFGPPGTDFGAPFGQDKGAKGEPGESSESAFKRGVEAAAAMYAAQFAGTKTTQAQPITVNVAPPSTTVQNYEKLEAKIDGKAIASDIGAAIKKGFDEMKIDLTVNTPPAEAPTVNVAAPIVSVAAPTVNVAPAQVNVPAPVIEKLEVTVKREPPVAKEFSIARAPDGTLTGEIKQKV